MYMNENMKNEVARNKNLEVLREMAAKNGMISLWESCRNIVLGGVTSIQELMTLTSE